MALLGGVPLQAIARRTLEIAQADPFDDPRIIVRRLGYSLFPVLQQDAPPYELIRQAICYRYCTAGDRRATSENVWLGLSAKLLRDHGYERSSEQLIQLTGLMAWPWTTAASPEELERHPHVRPELLRLALKKRRLDLSGMYALPRFG